jgi:hypothetical protein
MNNSSSGLLLGILLLSTVQINRGLSLSATSSLPGGGDNLYSKENEQDMALCHPWMPLLWKKAVSSQDPFFLVFHHGDACSIAPNRIILCTTYCLCFGTCTEARDGRVHFCEYMEAISALLTRKKKSA